MFDLVIFDNDGVLVDSEPIANAVLAELLTTCGLPTTVEHAVAAYVGRSLAGVRRVAEARLGRALPADFEARYEGRLFAAFPGRLRPVPGVVEALAAIATPVCVASNGTRERIRRALATVGLWERFAGRAFSAEDVPREKPAPDLLLHAARTLGVAPARCAVVEDTPAGIAAAAAAGMTSFGFAGLAPAGGLASATGGVFRRMADLPGLLARPAPPPRPAAG